MAQNLIVTGLLACMDWANKWFCGTYLLKMRPELEVTPEPRRLLADGSCLRLLPQGGLPLGLRAMDPFGAGKPGYGVPGPPVSDRLDGSSGDTVCFPDLPGT